ncbi:DUF2293 domain-containing protein [Actinomadura xylanilytica]|uniref:DUF2293 domain-containing protein n=1 Tax=Actinomadura xylanilytica TaxID=887459 RepID=UPI00255A9F18|nr:DUF2293 domain-containing protein [Actinomadura xylanilytica]MDL4774402.1 DUF2293 domain-containing protein [Actinomadura xylanilytica]
MSLGRRVEDAADGILKRTRSVSAVEVFTQIRWLRTAQVDEWRQGRHASLEAVMPVGADRIGDAARALRAWAEARGLDSSEAVYLAATRDRRALRFTAAGGEAAERALRLHWTSPDLTPAQRERLTAKQNRAPDLVAVVPEKAWACAGCGGTGEFHLVEDDAPLCLACADLDHLVFLPSGDAALSRRAKKESGLSALVMRFNRRRKRYERRGLLVEEAALQRAEELCLADEDARSRRRDRDRGRRAEQDLDLQERMAAEIVRLFPGCPADRAAEIAGHAAVRGSGRVGRSAAGRELDEEAVTLAVVASVRHLDTGYDRLLMDGVPRADARAAIRATVDRVLNTWRRAP